MKSSQQWLAWALAASFPLVKGSMQYPNCVDGPLSTNLVCDQKAAPADRAAALVKAMNITEKLDNLLNQAKGAPRIGLPPYGWWNEALHGVAGSPSLQFAKEGNFSSATSFAIPITLAAAFDDDLVERIATVIGTEGRAFANSGRAGLDYWTPNINPFKDPRWGRGMETPGEDPLRVKHYTKALLRGLEGDDPKTRKIIATCKHYAAYDLERWHGVTRYGFDAIISPQDLAEYYLPPFQQCARDSKVGSFMCSYNSVNGTPACASDYLITDILKKHWGWEGEGQYITSDCDAVQKIYTDHKYAKSAAEAVAQAIDAGTDTICQGSASAADIVAAHEQGLLTEAAIDTALGRLYEGLARAGYFDPPSSAYHALGWSDVNTAEAHALALRSAADALVLKKNAGGALPLPGGGMSQKLALIGHWAGGTGRSMLGGYSGVAPFMTTPLAAARELNLSVSYAAGPIAPAPGVSDTWTAPALAAARDADVVLYFGGIDGSVEGEERDREAIAWPQAQLDLVAALARLGKPLAVLQMGDQADDTPLLANANVSALLWAGYPGQDGGRAVMRAVTGAHAPAGRLPVTVYPASYVDAVPMTDMALRPGKDNPGRTYRWYPDAVLPFGFGLHYTTFNATFASPSAVASKTFAIADLVGGPGCKEAAHKDLCPFPDVEIAVKNNGTGGEKNATATAAGATSDFVALAFVKGEYGPKPYPRKTLVAYTRLRGVKPGDTATGKLSMSLGALARTDEKGSLVLFPGEYTMLLDEPTQAEMTFTLTGEAAVLDTLPLPSAKSATGYLAEQF